VWKHGAPNPLGAQDTFPIINACAEGMWLCMHTRDLAFGQISYQPLKKVHVLATQKFKILYQPLFLFFFSYSSTSIYFEA
jgi:hypothetical protein